VDGNLTAAWVEEKMDFDSATSAAARTFEFAFRRAGSGRAVATGSADGGKTRFVLAAQMGAPATFTLTEGDGRVWVGTRVDPAPEKTFWQRWGSMLLMGVLMVVQLGSRLMFGGQTAGEVTQQIAEAGEPAAQTAAGAAGAAPATAAASGKKGAKGGKPAADESKKVA
jgi:hypothetical protein